MVPATIYHLQRRQRLKTRRVIEFSAKLVYGLASVDATTSIAVKILSLLIKNLNPSCPKNCLGDIKKVAALGDGPTEDAYT